MKHEEEARKKAEEVYNFNEKLRMEFETQKEEHVKHIKDKDYYAPPVKGTVCPQWKRMDEKNIRRKTMTWSNV